MARHPDVLEAFSRTVARLGDKLAVIADDGRLTYRELDHLSNQLAHRLRSLGVERESLVGISLSRGVLELLAMLATMKAGGCYVPLDPSHPEERLRGIITDAPPQVMLVHPGSGLGAAAPERTLVLDGLGSAVAGQPDTALDSKATPDQLVYILFTSGSTGKPKGVEIMRGALANFLGSMAREPGLAEQERLLAITTTSFDIAELELYLPLLVGATVVIADKETARDPRKLRGRLEAGDITALQATPATWRLLLEAGWRGDGKLRMLCGGEAMSPALADRLLAAGGELWNVYGPTETTVWSTLARIEPGYDKITIGRPIDETQVYVLDESLNPVPTGQEGELWIGGAGLARGYRGRPDLTAERFVSNPRGPAGERIYRTGDLGRQLPDGRFECLGRLDHQVKIQGFRIELPEIEGVLRGVAGVDETLVVADRQESGEARLVAYWVGTADRRDLVAAARQKLPAYMVPAAYVPLQTMPLNTNGKIDRKQLPRPEAAERAPRPPASRPPSPVEARIASVWTQVLGTADVPLDQSFFTVGGTSVLALKAVARIEHELGVELTLQAFFAAPTVEGIAASIGQKFSPDAPVVARLRDGQPDRPPLFCLFGITLYQDLALELSEDRPVFGLHVPVRYAPGRDAVPSLAAIAARYVEILRREQPRGPYHLLGLCFGGIVAYEAASQLVALGEPIGSVTIIDAVLPPAMHVDQARRFLGLATRIWERPNEVVPIARKKLAQLAERPPLRSLFGKGQPDGEAPRPIDLPVDGPEADAIAARFAAHPGKLPARVLVVRASRDPWPAWVTIDHDQGWAGRADRVVVRDVPANHLGVLREPHVRELASAVTEIMGEGKAASDPHPLPRARAGRA
jgi:amino acid adenylation domain-containing protein